MSSSSCWEDGGCGSGGCSVGEQEVERPKAHRGLEEARAGGDPNSDDREAADGRGSHRDEGQPRDQRGRGRGPIRFDKQAQQERWPNGTGHRQPDEEVSGPSQVPGGCGTMPTSSRRTSVQGKSAGEVVDMHSLRGPMVPTGRSSSILCNNGLPGDSSGRSPEDPKQPSGIPELFATAQGEAGAGTTRGRDGTEHSVHIFFSGTEGGHYEGKDSDDFGGIAANPTGQNANRCEPPARDLRDQLGKRILISGDDLLRCQQKQARKLASSLKDRGWVIKTLMIMLSMAQWQGLTELQVLGKPREVGRWSDSVQQWLWDEETQNSQETSSTGSSWSLRTNSLSGETQNTRETSSTGSTWCYIFPVDQVHRDWLGDIVGRQLGLDKVQTRRILESLHSQILDGPVAIHRAREHQAKAQGVFVGHAIDMNTAWDFDIKNHRRESLRLVNQHRPAVLLLGSNGTV